MAIVERKSKPDRSGGVVDALASRLASLESLVDPSVQVRRQQAQIAQERRAEAVAWYESEIAPRLANRRRYLEQLQHLRAIVADLLRTNADLLELCTDDDTRSSAQRRAVAVGQLERGVPPTLAGVFRADEIEWLSRHVDEAVALAETLVRQER